MNKPHGTQRKETPTNTGKSSQLGHEPGNEGEGSRIAAKDYNERTDEFIRSGRVESSAKNAERSVEGKERSELEKAEARRKKHTKH